MSGVLSGSLAGAADARRVDEASIRCEEYQGEVDEFTAVAETWRFRSDGRERYRLP